MIEPVWKNRAPIAWVADKLDLNVKKKDMGLDAQKHLGGCKHDHSSVKEILTSSLSPSAAPSPSPEPNEKKPPKAAPKASFDEDVYTKNR